MAADSLGTLQKLAAMGYSKVEFAGLHDHPATEVAEWLKQLNLISPSSHADLRVMFAEPQKVIDDALALGNTTLIVPWLPENLRSKAAWPQVRDTLMGWSELASNNTLQLGYHNHDFEFADENGWRLFDALMTEFTAEQLTLELDLFWITKAGVDVAAHLQGHAARITHCHIKDMNSAGEMTEVGSGEIDFAQHLRTLESTEPGRLQHHYVEHDRPNNALASAQTSIAHLNTLRY